MTLDEARALAAIIGTIDGGCDNCAGSFICELNKAIPAFRWTVRDDWYGREEHDRVDVAKRGESEGG